VTSILYLDLNIKSKLEITTLSYYGAPTTKSFMDFSVYNTLINIAYYRSISNVINAMFWKYLLGPSVNTYIMHIIGFSDKYRWHNNTLYIIICIFINFLEFSSLRDVPDHIIMCNNTRVRNNIIVLLTISKTSIHRCNIILE